MKFSAKGQARLMAGRGEAVLVLTGGQSSAVPMGKLLHPTLSQQSLRGPGQTTAPIGAPSSSRICGFDYNMAVCKT